MLAAGPRAGHHSCTGKDAGAYRSLPKNSCTISEFRFQALPENQMRTVIPVVQHNVRLTTGGCSLIKEHEFGSFVIPAKAGIQEV
jgi:hypothetical protein